MPRSRIRLKGRADRKTDIFDPIDIYIGRRVRERRRELGISQKELADALGLSHQQVQKYERADDRISASRLFRISEILDVGLPFFFECRTGAGSAGRIIPADIRGAPARRFARRTRMIGRAGR